MINGDVGGGGTLQSRGTVGRGSQRVPPALHVAARKDDVNGATQLLQNVLATGQPAEVRHAHTHHLHRHLLPSYDSTSIY